MQQTWMERDLPALDATVAMLEDDPMATSAGKPWIFYREGWHLEENPASSLTRPPATSHG